MRNRWTTGDPQIEGIAMMTTGRKAMAMVAMAIGIKWNFLERERTVGEVQIGVAGLRVDATGLSMTEAGVHPDIGAGIAAGTQIALL